MPDLRELAKRLRVRERDEMDCRRKAMQSLVSGLGWQVSPDGCRPGEIRVAMTRLADPTEPQDTPEDPTRICEGRGD